MKLLMVLGIWCGSLGGVSAALSVCSSPVDSAHELLIRDLSVVESDLSFGGGPWSFSQLIREKSPRHISPQEFVQKWLAEWDKTTHNAYSLVPRAGDRILNLWPKDSQGQLILDEAPFRLLAIVNRTDLWTTRVPGGEGRLIFGLYDPWNNRPLEFLVIFEFEQSLGSGESPSTWARRWHDLSCVAFGENYNQMLKSITELFKTRLLQVRTNDFFLDSHWELREFVQDPSGFLTLSTTAQTPHSAFNGQRRGELLNWIQGHEQEILEESHHVPFEFLSGAVPLRHESFRWLLNAGLTENVRKRFSMNTCNGCHGGDTHTVFTHVHSRAANQFSRISVFLEADLARRARQMELLIGEFEVGVLRGWTKKSSARVH